MEGAIPQVPGPWVSPRVPSSEPSPRKAGARGVHGVGSHRPSPRLITSNVGAQGGGREGSGWVETTEKCVCWWGRRKQSSVIIEEEAVLK